jgi:hypothetical protein
VPSPGQAARRSRTWLWTGAALFAIAATALITRDSMRLTQARGLRGATEATVDAMNETNVE